MGQKDFLLTHTVLNIIKWWKSVDGDSSSVAYCFDLTLLNLPLILGQWSTIIQIIKEGNLLLANSLIRGQSGDSWNNAKKNYRNKNLLNKQLSDFVFSANTYFANAITWRTRNYVKSNYVPLFYFSVFFKMRTYISNQYIRFSNILKLLLSCLAYSRQIVSLIGSKSSF